LDPPYASLFNDFRKEDDEKPRELNMFAQMGQKIG